MYDIIIALIFRISSIFRKQVIRYYDVIIFVFVKQSMLSEFLISV